MLTMEKLQSFGADTKDGLARCMNNEAMYLKLVDMALGDENYEKLSAAVEAGDRKAAFEAVHAIKGVVGNLALTPLYEASARMTELLRENAEGDDREYLRQILSCREKLLTLRDQDS